MAAMPAGLYTIHLTAWEYRSRTIERFEIIAGETVTLEQELIETVPNFHMFTVRHNPPIDSIHRAMEPPPLGAIAGTIRDTSGRAIRGVFIRILRISPARGAISTADGNFGASNIPQGIYDVHISSPDYYTSVARGVVISGDSTSMLHIRLTPKSREDIDLEMRNDCTPVTLSEKFGTIRQIPFDEKGRPR